MNAAYKKFEKLAKEKDSYKSAYEDEQAKHENTRKSIKAVCHLEKDISGDKNYRRIISKIDDNTNPRYKKAFRNMIALDREAMIMSKQKDEKSREHIAFEDNAMVKIRQKKDEGSDLELQISRETLSRIYEVAKSFYRVSIRIVTFF